MDTDKEGFYYSNKFWKLPTSADEAQIESGIHLPVDFTVEQANRFISGQTVEQNARIFHDEVIAFYQNLSDSDKERFVWKDRALDLIEQYSPICHL